MIPVYKHADYSCSGSGGRFERHIAITNTGCLRHGRNSVTFVKCIVVKTVLCIGLERHIASWYHFLNGTNS